MKASSERFRVIDSMANPDGEISVDIGDLVRVPPGEYQLAFESYRTALVYGRIPKVGLKFKIIDQGEHFGKELYRWYNVKGITGKPRKSGGFKVGRNGDFLIEYLTLFPTQLKRLDRISFSGFRKNVIRGRVETVKRNSRQKPLPEILQYSIIRELTGIGA